MVTGRCYKYERSAVIRPSGALDTDDHDLYLQKDDGRGEGSARQRAGHSLPVTSAP